MTSEKVNIVEYLSSSLFSLHWGPALAVWFKAYIIFWFFCWLTFALLSFGVWRVVILDRKIRYLTRICCQRKHEKPWLMLKELWNQVEQELNHFISFLLCAYEVNMLSCFSQTSDTVSLSDDTERLMQVSKTVKQKLPAGSQALIQWAEENSFNPVTSYTNTPVANHFNLRVREQGKLNIFV